MHITDLQPQLAITAGLPFASLSSGILQLQGLLKMAKIVIDLCWNGKASLNFIKRESACAKLKVVGETFKKEKK